MTFTLMWYLQINILLVASYLVFRVCLRLSPHLKFQPKFATATRVGQTLVLASVLIPLALAVTPSGKLPRLNLAQAQPFSDGVGVTLRTKVGPRIQAALPDFVSTRDGQRLGVTALLANAKPGFLKTLALLLLVGIGLMSWRLSKSIRQLTRLVGESAVVRRIGRVSILVSDAISVPMSTLVTFRAVIAVPPQIVANASDLRIAIRHELQHHRRRDTAWAVWIELVVSLCFANPAIYLWRRQLVELQEFSCDEALIGRRGVRSQDYGRCLLRAAEAALRTQRTLAGTACMAAGSENARYFKSLLRRRIEMFTQDEISTRTRGAAITLGLLSLLATAAVAYGAQQVFRPNEPALPNPGRAGFNPTVQGIAERALRSAVDSDGAEAGFVLVSEPSSGRLLAAANVSKDPTKQGRAWSLSYRLDPASAMKGLTAAFAVNRHVIAFDELLNCENGEYQYGNGVVVHDETPVHSLSTTDTVVKSNNICGVKIGERLGVASLAKMLGEFGFGRGGTTDGFPEATAGEIPGPGQLSDEEYVALVSAGVLSLPQFTVTPLEMVQAYGAIANEGRLMKPLGASDPDSDVSVVRQVLDQSTAEAAKVVLRKVVTDGTGKAARSSLYTTAGKTSTASAPGPAQRDGLDEAHSVAGFIGFAPVESPRVVIYVGILDPERGTGHQPYGSRYAAPVFREVAEQVLQSMNVEADVH